MRKLGFTVIELMTVIMILGVIATITSVTVFKNSKLDEKIIESSSKSFYTAAEIALGEIIRDEAPSGIKHLTSEELMEKFVRYMEGYHLTNSSSVTGDCSSFVGGEVAGTNYISEAKCARFMPKIIAGFYVNPECTQSITIKEYSQQDTDIRNIDDACGYIIYEPLKSKGTFGYDLFVIGLGNRRFR